MLAFCDVQGRLMQATNHTQPQNRLKDAIYFMVGDGCACWLLEEAGLADAVELAAH
jgi:hypothetical protein